MVHGILRYLAQKRMGFDRAVVLLTMDRHARACDILYASRCPQLKGRLSAYATDSAL